MPCVWSAPFLYAEVRTSASLAARPLQCLCCVSGVWAGAGGGVWLSVRACLLVTACPASLPAVSLSEVFIATFPGRCRILRALAVLGGCVSVVLLGFGSGVGVS